MIVKTEESGKRWAVVGGGMLGLTLAHRMSAAGHSVSLLESAPQLGGLASVWNLDQITWERYYHVILLSDSRLRNLLEELDLADTLKWVETKTGFFTNGQLYSMNNTAEFFKFPPLNFIEKLRLGGTIFYASKIRNWKRLEKIGVEQWLRRWSGRGTFEKIWEPLLKAKLGESYKKTAASFIWAHISRMYKARRSGHKKEMFGYVTGGYSSILRRLAEVLYERQVDVRVDHRVQQVKKREDGRFEISFDNQPPLVVDRVIMTAPSPAIAESCVDLKPDETKRLRGIEYLGIVCASLLLKKPISPYYVTNITDTWVPMTGVIEMSNIVERQELDGHSLVYLPKYIPPGHELFNRSDDEIEEMFLGALEKMYPSFSRSDVVAFRISRTRNVMALSDNLAIPIRSRQ